MNEHDNKPTDDGVANADTVAEAVLSEKLADAQTPGFWTEFAPDEAELAGAFEEAALGVEEAAESDIDMLSLEEGDAKE